MQKLSQLFGDAGSDLAELLFLFNENTEVTSSIDTTGHIGHYQSDVDVLVGARGPDLNFGVSLPPGQRISICFFAACTLELQVLSDHEAVLVDCQLSFVTKLDVHVLVKLAQVGHEHLCVVFSPV